MSSIHENYIQVLKKIKKRTTKECSDSTVSTDAAKAPAPMLAAALFTVARM